MADAHFGEPPPWPSPQRLPSETPRSPREGKEEASATLHSIYVYVCIDIYVYETHHYLYVLCLYLYLYLYLDLRGNDKERRQHPFIINTSGCMYIALHTCINRCIHVMYVPIDLVRSCVDLCVYLLTYLFQDPPAVQRICL